MLRQAEQEEKLREESANFSPPVCTRPQVFSQALVPLTSAGIRTATSTTPRQIKFGLKAIW